MMLSNLAHKKTHFYSWTISFPDLGKSITRHKLARTKFYWCDCHQTETGRPEMYTPAITNKHSVLFCRTVTSGSLSKFFKLFAMPTKWKSDFTNKLCNWKGFLSWQQNLRCVLGLERVQEEQKQFLPSPSFRAEAIFSGSWRWAQRAITALCLVSNTSSFNSSFYGNECTFFVRRVDEGKRLEIFRIVLNIDVTNRGSARWPYAKGVIVGSMWGGYLVEITVLAMDTSCQIPCSNRSARRHTSLSTLNCDAQNMDLTAQRLPLNDNPSELHTRFLPVVCYD